MEDTHAAVLHIRKDYPDAPLLGVGFSYGGQTMRGYMGHKQPGSGIEGFLAGVEISSMFEVDKVGSHVDGTIYDWLNTTQLLTRLNEDLPWIFREVSIIEDREDQPEDPTEEPGIPAANASGAAAAAAAGVGDEEGDRFRGEVLTSAEQEVSTSAEQERERSQSRWDMVKEVKQGKAGIKDYHAEVTFKFLQPPAKTFDEPNPNPNPNPNWR